MPKSFKTYSPWRVALPLMAAVGSSGGIAEAQWARRFALRAELGGGTMLSEYQRNQGFGYGYQVSPRLGFSLLDALAIQVSFSTWGFPVEAGTGRVLMPSAGLRFEPAMRPSGRLFVDANVGLVSTGSLRRAGFDVGVGFEFRVTRTVNLGPVLRYGQVVQLDASDPGFSADAIFFSVGLSVALRSARDTTAGPEEEAAARMALDSDGDGVPNAVDRCREEPETRNGFEDDDGCPDSTDRDHDGINNDQDRCPDEGEDRDGFQDEDGCADTDDDGDGLPDLADQCPREAETVNGNTDEDGCPDQVGDRDHDGLRDDRDRCPTEPETFNGSADDDGCPDRGEALVTIEGDQIHIAEQVVFANGRAILRGRTSFRTLDTVATLLRLAPQIGRVDIQGYTDDHGDPAANRTLSERRANTVMQYLMAHGVSASRLEAHGFGQENPLVPNNGALERSLNRRVEFHIMAAGGSAQPEVSPEVSPAVSPTVPPTEPPATSPAALPFEVPRSPPGRRHRGRHRGRPR